MYISVIPWIFNILLVATIILLTGELLVARKDEREAYNRMLEFFGESDHGRKLKKSLRQKFWESRVAKSISPSKALLRVGEYYSPNMDALASTTESFEKGEESMDGKNMIALTTCIKRWVKDREIDRSHPQAQFVKVVEEVGEIAEGLAKKDKQLITDGVGDVYVTLVALCATLGLEIDECVYQAYKEIENRKGEMVDGVFIKEEDL